VHQSTQNPSQHSGGNSLLPDHDDGLEDILEGRGGGGQQQRGGKPRPNKKRQAKDKKFGFGGPKRKLKQADSKSLNDFSAFNPKKGKSFGGGGGAGAKRKGAGASRPGKTARHKARQQRR
jgi:rRNA-processing protein EBP2